MPRLGKKRRNRARTNRRLVKAGLRPAAAPQTAAGTAGGVSARAAAAPGAEEPTAGNAPAAGTGNGDPAGASADPAIPDPADAEPGTSWPGDPAPPPGEWGMRTSKHRYSAVQPVQRANPILEEPVRERKRVLFCLLHPGFPEPESDPAVRGYAKHAARFGCTDIEIVALYSCRLGDPAWLPNMIDRCGPGNDDAIRAAAARADLVVAAWGPLKKWTRRRAEYVTKILAAHRDVYALGGPTADGGPRKPGSAPADAPLRLHAPKAA